MNVAAIRQIRASINYPSFLNATIFQHKLAKMGFLFLAYFSTARLGATLFNLTANGSALIWPPAGISIAALYLGGYSYWPAIALGSLLNSIYNGSPVITAVTIALANTLQAAAGAYILKRFRFDKKISALKDMLLIILVGFVATTIAPTLGLAVATWDIGFEISSLGSRWVVWWLGGLFSVVILTPLLISWIGPVRIGNRKRFFEGLLAVGILSFLYYMLFWTTTTSFLGISLVYLMIMPLFWIALRLGTKQTALAIFLLATMMLSSIFLGPRNLPVERLDSALKQGELFVMIISFIFLILAAISDERKKNSEMLKEHVKQLENALETIRQHALQDALTALPNRKALEERFLLSRSMAMRHQHKLAVLFLDLDQFKNVNDTLGHNVGDLVLKEAADRLKNSVRDLDTVARLGGDEFIIVLSEIQSNTDIELVADKILQAFRVPMYVQNHIINTSASIGVAVYPDSGETIDSLLKNADIALYRAKDRGRNRFMFYDLEMKNRLHAKISLEKDLKVAIEKNQLRLEYQPIIDLQTDKVQGAEALLRWDHPILGPLKPNDFIPLAEDTGLILPIGNWVLKRACKQIAQWKKDGMGIAVSVNISSKQLNGTNLVENIAKVIKKYEINPNCLELEITESIAMQNPVHTGKQLEDLVRMGVSITMDDFGTGYSSLSYLKGLYLQKLKIDRSFVKDVIVDPQDEVIIRTIVSMGHTLGLKVCAEGIETNEQKQILQLLGCDSGQGYYICRPIDGDELIKKFRHQAMPLPVALGA
jgi:diguanylate cyclase (GGDEF)-like protein